MPGAVAPFVRPLHATVEGTMTFLEIFYKHFSECEKFFFLGVDFLTDFGLEGYCLDYITGQGCQIGLFWLVGLKNLVGFLALFWPFLR